jgi:TPR repeat protein
VVAMRRVQVAAAVSGRRALLLLPLLVCAAIASAERYHHFPGATADARTARIQERVEDLYSSREYPLALQNYRDFLAPLGDKYAQYMVGYMHLTGRGTEADPALALAWYRLAAERSERPYVEARDSLRATLDVQQLALAQQHYDELLPDFGDRKLLLTLMQKDIELLKRLDSEPAGDHLVSGFLGSSNYDLRALARERLQQRLKYLERMPGVAALAELERDVRAALADE